MDHLGDWGHYKWWIERTNVHFFNYYTAKSPYSDENSPSYSKIRDNTLNIVLERGKYGT